MILYLGNNISSHGLTPTAMEHLVPKLNNNFRVISASSKKFFILRFLHMIYTYFINIRNLDLVIIDVFSSKAFFYAFFCRNISFQIIGKFLYFFKCNIYFYSFGGNSSIDKQKKNLKYCNFLSKL